MTKLMGMADNLFHFSTRSLWQISESGKRPSLLMVMSLFLLPVLALAEEPVPGEESAQDSPAPVANENIQSAAFQREQALLAEASEESELLWLEVRYPDQEETLRVLSLHMPPRKAEIQGGVLILHDTGQHASWPGTVEILRHQLPDSGWHTLSINLPYPDQPVKPERELPDKQTDRIQLSPAIQANLSKRPARQQDNSTSGESSQQDSAQKETDDASTQNADETSETNKQASSEEAVDINLSDPDSPESESLPYDVRALAHLRAGIDQLAAKGYRNIILVTIGESAKLALDYIKPLASSIKDRGFALIMINAQLNKEFQRDVAASLGKQFQAPVLDLVDSANLQKVAQSEHRIRMAKASKIKAYQQMLLPNIETSLEQKTLLRRIDAWLKKHAPGMSAVSMRSP